MAQGDFLAAAGLPGRDGLPEVVVVGNGQIALVPGQTGQVLVGPSPLPSGASCVVGGGDTGSGGPPTVADFDGDGRAEVVCADELAVHVFDGATGQNLLQLPHCSGTAYAYPVIVDVNGNGRANIVVPVNTHASAYLGCPAGIIPGIHVLRDAKDQWVNTRAIWNQHTYHVTNVCDGRDWVCGGPGAAGNTYGRVPTTEPNNWTFAQRGAGRRRPAAQQLPAERAGRRAVQRAGPGGEGPDRGERRLPGPARAPGPGAQPGRAGRAGRGAGGVLRGRLAAPSPGGGAHHPEAPAWPERGGGGIVGAARGPELAQPVVAVVDDDGTGAGPIQAYCGTPIG
jgi:hypothetical protein